MKRKTTVFLSLFFLFFLIAVQPVSADYRSKVLGESTAKVPNIPPTIEGPGLILPDSPLFFLDEFKQTVRVFFAFNSEAKAKVYTDIAGERFAELRFMIAKNNKSGINTDLNGVSENYKKASEELSLAKLSGKNTSRLAAKINDGIKLKQQLLDVLESGVSGEMKERTSAAQEALVVAKVKTEESLPAIDSQSEVSYDLQRQMQRHVNESIALSKAAAENIIEFKSESAIASISAIKVREEALSKAIAEKNKVVQREQEQLLKMEKEKNAQLISEEMKEAALVMESVKKTQALTIQFQKVKKTVEQLRNTPASAIKAIPTPTPKAKVTPKPSPKPTSGASL